MLKDFKDLLTIAPADSILNLKMSEALRHLFIGLSAVFYAPANCLPRPRTLITLPPKSSTQAIAYDFCRVSGDFNRSIERIKNAKQLDLDLGLKSERIS